MSSSMREFLPSRSETKAPKTDQTRPDLIDQYLSAGSMFNSVDDSKVPGLNRKQPKLTWDWAKGKQTKLANNIHAEHEIGRVDETEIEHRLGGNLRQRPDGEGKLVVLRVEHLIVDGDLQLEQSTGGAQ
ncbi:hypothetical protein TYRP_003187 [Tyrophagus putrescentiae]|nr:hypothetical protein TYRP_003187 [Tyrophagus putrescentiae]